METRHPVEGQFGSELLAICNHCGVDCLKSQDLEILWAFFRLKKTISLKLTLLCGLRPNSARVSPHIWLTLFQILSKSVHFRRSYCRTREDRFRPMECFHYGLLKPITRKQWIERIHSPQCRCRREVGAYRALTLTLTSTVIVTSQNSINFSLAPNLPIGRVSKQSLFIPDLLLFNKTLF